MPDTILDQTALDNLLATAGGDKTFLAEMIVTFLADSPKQITAMRDAAANVRADELRRAAHTLKSNSANFGAMNLSKLCKELEKMGKDGALAGAIERIAQVEAEYAQVQSALKKILE